MHKCSNHESYLLMNSFRYTLASVNQKNQCLIRCYSEDSEKPLPFSKSKAASLSGHVRFSTNNNDDSPWYQPLSISLSLSAILLWFCVFREENDVDKELTKSLYDRVEGLEKKQLQLALQHNQTIDTVAIHRRLKELESNEK